MVVKTICTTNYAPGKLQEYLEWVKKVVPILTAPEELKKMSAWDNWVGGSPHRMVEFEFEDSKAYEKWVSREEIRKVIDEWRDLATNHDIQVYKQIYEMAK